MANMLLQDVEYAVDERSNGTWRRYMYTSGQVFAEYRSHREINGWPLVHIAWGRHPETGRLASARGWIAIAPRAYGALAVGIFSCGFASAGVLSAGLLSAGTLSLGVFASLGMLSIAPGVSIGGLAAGCVAIAQMALGYIAIGQLAIGYYVLGQLGIGAHVVSQELQDPVAVEFFRGLGFPF